MKELVLQAKRRLGRVARWLSEHAWLWTRMPRLGSARPAVVIFPSGHRKDPASDLRCWRLAPELRELGWRALVAPTDLDLRQRHRLLARVRPDVVLLQQSRHPLNRPELYPGVACVFDADDADYLDPRCHDTVIRCCEGSRAVIAGSQFLADCFARHNPDVTIVWTATPLPARRNARPPSQRARIVAWAHSNPLLYPLEATLVREILLALAKRTKFEFWLFGTEPERADAYLAELRATGIECRSFSYMAYERYLERVGDAAVGIQPVCLENEFSRGKSFGKVLAYVSRDVPVVASDAVDHHRFFRHGWNGFLANDVDEWVAALQQLLEDPALRDRVASHAYQDFEARLTTEVAAKRVDAVLRRLLGGAAAETAAGG